MASIWTSLRGRPLIAWLTDNPLLVREMRRRMRGKSFTWALIGYLVALGLVSCFLMYSNYPSFSETLSTRELILKVNAIGSILFRGMFFVETIIAVIVTPMITAGLATAEKEKDTFEFLQVTTLSPGMFVVGCLLTTGSFLFMVFACTLPILGLTFIFGGVSLSDILVFNGMLFLLSLTISAWGIFNSTSYKRSRTVLGAIALALLLIMVVVLPSLGLTLVGRGMGTMGGSGLQGYIALGMVTLIAAFSIAAARRLYEPNNRLFTYKQFTGFFVLALGLLMALILWQLSSTGVLGPVSVDEKRRIVLFFFAFGAVLLAMAILIFSAGRVERGDELWRLRLERPAFRSGLDAGLVYFMLIGIWLASAVVMAQQLLLDSSLVMQALLPAVAPALSNLFLLYSLCRLTSVLTETRNRAAIGAMGVASVLWILLPLFGFFVAEVTTVGNMQPSVLVETIGKSLVDLSPAVVLSRILAEAESAEIIRPTILTLVLAASVLLLTFVSSLRRRLAVSYDFSVRGEPALAAGTVDAD